MGGCGERSRALRLDRSTSERWRKATLPRVRPRQDLRRLSQVLNQRACGRVINRGDIAPAVRPLCASWGGGASRALLLRKRCHGRNPLLQSRGWPEAMLPRRSLKNRRPRRQERHHELPEMPAAVYCSSGDSDGCKRGSRFSIFEIASSFLRWSCRRVVLSSSVAARCEEAARTMANIPIEASSRHSASRPAVPPTARAIQSRLGRSVV